MKKIFFAFLILAASLSAAHAVMYAGNNLISRHIAEEGMVLLRNENNALPLSKTDNAAVFGPAQMDFQKGGGGSAWVSSSYSLSIPEGLINSAKADKVRFHEALYNEYKADKNIEITVEKAKEVAKSANTAIVCVAHNSREGHDRKAVKGDWFLSEKEEEALAAVSKAGFDKVIVVLNVCGVIDTSWVDTYKPDAVLYCSLPGTDGGDAVARTLVGDVNPSGKLTDTWAKSLEDYPSNAGFGNPDFIDYTENVYVGYRYFTTFKVPVRYPFGYGLSYTTFKITDKSVTTQGRNVVVSAKITNTGNREGKEVLQVYVRAPKGKIDKPAAELRGFAKTQTLAPGKSEVVKVLFPKTDMASFDEYGDTGHKSAWVLEAGSYEILAGNSVTNASPAGVVTVAKTAVTNQLTNRITPTNLEKILTADGAYRKVPTYNPGAKVVADDTTPVSARTYTVIEAENFTNSFHSANRADFTYPDGTPGKGLFTTDFPASGAAYFLNVEKAGKYDVYFSLAGEYEGGDFTVRVNKTDAANVKVAPSGKRDFFTYRDPVRIDLPEGFVDFKVVTGRPYGNIDRFVIVPAADSAKLFEEAKNNPPAPTKIDFDYKERTTVNGKIITWNDVIKNRSLLSAFIGQLSDEELAYMAQGHPGRETGNVGSMKELGCPGLETFDGGHGARISDWATCMPALTMVASTWNVHIVDEYCRALGREAAINGVELWLAPGFNIHRHPLCGRNFEYFSEDPLITGKFGAAFVRGGHKYGYSSMIKHFTANNCETNRSDIDTRVTERAMREIYLRGYERAVREGGALYIMSSYNLINGTEVSESASILTDILRGEWGFGGIVCTDWGNNSNQTREILAGDNVKMPSGSVDYILEDLAKGKISREDLRKNAASVFGAMLKSRDYRVTADENR